ncbi:MAG: L-glyceraldehyde 3-phosphate reductase, partial [Kiritimatiellaceae bacterium]|nr:L-glyceraldehyde 3-phosphate reductase [Kiritimatiellaceae bacterium]
MNEKPYTACSSRYDAMQYKRVGASGFHLPALSLGL